MGGALDGYSSSYVVDIDSYKYRHEYKYILGPLQDQQFLEIPIKFLPVAY